MKKVIEDLLKDERVINEIKSFEAGEHAVHFKGKLIGEVTRYAIIHQSSEIKPEEVVKYLQKVKKVWHFVHKNGKSKDKNAERLERGRSMLIYKSIAEKLNIKTPLFLMSQKDKAKVKEYFLNNYVKNGYVFHSFPAARKDSVEKNGFSSVEKVWNNEQVNEVVKIFEKHGVMKALGGYGFYKPGGTYVEHNPDEILFHSLSSPEWFRFFTSASHVSGDVPLSKVPFFLKDKPACERNVMDLCKNAGLSEQETAKVKKLFEDTWEKLGQEELTTALIPKEKIGKADIDQAVPDNLSVEDTISYVLGDKAKQFEEHKGNVVDAETMQQITGSDIEVITIPPADRYIDKPNYVSESREELFDPAKNLTVVAKGVTSGAFMISFEQYTSILDGMEKAFAKSPHKLKEIDKCLDKLDEAIKNCELPEEQKNKIKATFEEYRNKRQELANEELLAQSM